MGSSEPIRGGQLVAGEPVATAARPHAGKDPVAFAKERKRLANLKFRNKKKNAAEAAELALAEAAEQLAAATREREQLLAEQAALEQLQAYQGQLADVIQQAEVADLEDCKGALVDAVAVEQLDTGLDGGIGVDDTDAWMKGHARLPPPTFIDLPIEGEPPRTTSAATAFGSAGSGDGVPTPSLSHVTWMPREVLSEHLQRQPGSARAAGASGAAASEAAVGGTAPGGTGWLGKVADSGSSATSGPFHDEPLSSLEWVTHVLHSLQRMARTETAVVAHGSMASVGDGVGVQGLGVMRQLMQDCTAWFATRFSLTAWQKRLFVRIVPTAMLIRRNAFFRSHLQAAMETWEACPHLHPQLERTLFARFAERQELISLLAEHRPEALLECTRPRLFPPLPPGAQPGPDGRPPLHHVALPVARYLEAELSPAQLEQLRRYWHRYQQRIAAAQKQAADAAMQAQWSAGLHSASWREPGQGGAGGSSAERAEALCSMSASLGRLSTHAHEEVRAVFELQAALNAVLTPLQHARVMLAAEPYFPDLALICPWLFSGTVDPASDGGGGSSPAGCCCASANLSSGGGPCVCGPAVHQ